jgi:hypothetical protein
VEDALEARTVDQLESRLFAREQRESRVPASLGELERVEEGEIRILVQAGQRQVDEQAQSAQPTVFFS